MDKLSPMMRQYMQIKEQNSDSILFFRLGDFYEMFFDDARVVSEELDLVLTGKDCGLEERAPMCGVPYHSCEAYIARLVSRGYKVAVCEQTEDPAKAKGLVKRDVIRVITPGTVIEDSMLDEARNNYLAAVYLEKGTVGLCFTDASTGDCHATCLSGDNVELRAVNELMRFSPSELLVCEGQAENAALKRFAAASDCTVTLRERHCFEPEATEPIVCRYLGVISVENVGIPSGGALSRAVGAAAEYLNDTGKGGSVVLKHIDLYTEAQFMRLDASAIRNLEICETMRTKSKKGSLLWVLDKTRTAMGKRLLRGWLEMPLLSVPEITLRQNAVEELAENTCLRGEIREYLSGIRDFERIMTKVVYGTANPRDILGLAETAHRFPLIKQALAAVHSRMLCTVYEDIDTLEDITLLIDSAVSEDAPALTKEGKIIKAGYNAEIDTLRGDMNGSTDALAEIELRERERTGIKNLRVRYNKVFGYYIEVTNSFVDRVPEDYIRKQTLTNCERYITEELKQLETRVLTAKDRVVQLEYEIFDGIRKQAAAAIERFQKTASAIARADVLCSFAVSAIENNYCRPVVTADGVIKITEGRHPVVEQLIDTPFVSNDTFLDTADDRCAIITGPNMAGKSTYMRQVALITLMAQTGSFVPATSAQIGVVDAVFTRVGASDDLASGKSTFMVEMSEVADILKYATRNSLLILDEIGRGTSTYDGMSIARAVLEYAADRRRLGAKTLFATHYHELTEMENELRGVKNYNIAVKKRGDDIIFLRRIVRGGADDSYGIEVAALSGIPQGVIERAKAILKQTLESGVVTYKTERAPADQLSLEIQGAQSLIADLRTIDADTLTPIEALGLLSELSKRAREI